GRDRTRPTAARAPAPGPATDRTGPMSEAVREGRRLTGYLDDVRSRLTGNLGALPVVLGLGVIWIVFQALNPAFLSADNLVNLTLQCAAVGTIAIGVVLVLLLGQIDLSVGSVSGLAAAILGVGLTQLSW